MKIAVEFEWQPIGSVTVVDAMLRFPAVGSGPGIYRIGLGPSHCYIGEAKNLARRFQGYRTPGGSPATENPRTNRRVNREIASYSVTGPVEVWICTEAFLSADDECQSLDLSDTTNRLLLESAAIAQARIAGFTLENLSARDRTTAGTLDQNLPADRTSSELR